jgi:glycosyltransferase involved in cell wall biosynthesis
MKLLVPYVCPPDGGGGVHEVLLCGLPYLRNQEGFEIEYAETCGSQGDMDELASRGISVARSVGVPGRPILSYREGWGRLVDLVLAIPRLSRTTWNLRSWMLSGDAVYVHDRRNLFLVAVALRTLPSAVRPPIVYHCHGIISNKQPPFFDFVVKSCKKILAVSWHVQCILERFGVLSTQIRVIYNAVETAQIQKQSTQPSNPPLLRPGPKTLLVPAPRLRAEKGIHVAIDAMRYLGGDCFLWIAGSRDDPVSTRYQRQLDEQVDKYGLADRVQFIGHRKDIPAVMASCDLVLVPSLTESFGLVAAEAMAVGKPVIVSDRGGLPEVVDRGTAGLIYSAEDPRQLADKVRCVLEDNRLARSLVESGRLRVERVFNYVRWAREVAECLRAAVGASVRLPWTPATVAAIHQPRKQG